MARLLLALDRSTEDRLLADIVQYGHSVLARLSGERNCSRSWTAQRPTSRS
ncbi:hypothetical protein [Cryobacterium sp. 10C3]|uniref:hypothetical protein n=1 Tax=Cryobacterium sp. 10C3 TaxID=3048577 RepID=UPI002AB4AFE4|nr:hypothetical protein [Cryobacterium sp. 10C3]MDY7557465.1 hypothetical protein [Cryobacterium sp. 10C3]